MKTRKKEHSCLRQIGPLMFSKVYVEIVVCKQMDNGMKRYRSEWGFIGKAGGRTCERMGFSPSLTLPLLSSLSFFLPSSFLKSRFFNVLKCPYCSPALIAAIRTSWYFKTNQDTLTPLTVPGLKEPYEVVYSTTLSNPQPSLEFLMSFLLSCTFSLSTLCPCITFLVTS